MLGAALGFGAQQVVRDLIAGTFIVLERQYGYGDVVHISAVGFTEGATGTIEEVALRTTRLRTLNGEVVIVPNGQIVQVTNLSRDWARAVVDVPLPVEVDVMRASEPLRKVGEEAFDDEALRPLLLDPPTVMGGELRGRPGEPPDGGPDPARQAARGGSQATGPRGRDLPARGHRHLRRRRHRTGCGCRMSRSRPPATLLNAGCGPRPCCCACSSWPC
ncbi:MAG TPA: mechanosensitive ion channel domain-containing protein [Actinomycetota bacterium]|nr:mechanosensitive ion channel domain-containing protein [Actinomycetota bacterium]